MKQLPQFKPSNSRSPFDLDKSLPPLLFAPFNSDGYKLSHAPMYANGTNIVYSNLTPRTDRIYRRDKATKYYDGKLVLVGCQSALIEIVVNWNKFFEMNKGVALAQFKMLCDNYCGKDSVRIEDLSKLHDLGYLPLRIKTLEEGTKVPMGVPVLTIENTVPHAFWLVNFLETAISNLTWKTATVATIAAEYKRMLIDYAEKTGCAMEGVDYQAHSFACRGMSGPEDSARSEVGHIASFKGTDSLGSIINAMHYYGAKDFVAGSIPATEHAVATSNILRIEKQINCAEYEFVNAEQSSIFYKMAEDKVDTRLIAEVMFMYELVMVKFPTGFISYVCDSFDFWGMLTIGLPYMKDAILSRDGKVVIRPDSGDPVKVVCGFKEDQYRRTHNGVAYPLHAWSGAVLVDYSAESIPEYEIQGAVEVLCRIFGGTFTTGNNGKDYMLMNEKIGLIYGDSITPQRCLEILDGMEQKGYASANCVFGVGSYTYQCNTRDTHGFAVKATYTEVNGEPVVIFKDPKTDSKKKSAKGLLCVALNDEGEYTLLDNVTRKVESGPSNSLITRFEDGEFYNLTTLEDIRAKLVRG